MTVVPYQKHHEDIIRKWFMDYSLPYDMQLPEIGFVAEDGAPIAAAFLRKIEGNYGLFDGLIVDPKCSGKKRNAALNAAVEKLKEKARTLKMEKILAYTRESAVWKRALKQGFELQPDHFMILKV